MTFKTNMLSVALIAGITGFSMTAIAAPSAEVTLQGTLTNTTCDVTINGGKSVLNVGVFKTADFTANTITNNVVEMPVTLTNCDEPETGNLVVQGITSVGNNEQNIFVSDDTQTVGFMIQTADKAKTLTNGQGIEVASDDGTYNFNIGMASTKAAPDAGTYSAPILISYIVN
nr:type 1 fimbrial protein [uncultured Moellerella sp.]